MPDLKPPSECANCGADIPRNSRACPSCGADERTGWREQSVYDGADIPDDEDIEAGDGIDLPDTDNPRKFKRRPSPVWVFVALGLILVLCALTLGLR